MAKTDDGWVVAKDHDDYEKEMYDVLAEDDEIVMCWPNDRKYNAVNGDTRKWKVGTVKIRPTPYRLWGEKTKRYNREMRVSDGGADGRMFLCGFCGEMTPDDDLSWNDDLQSMNCKVCHCV